MPKGFVYILECSDGTYYTGSTIDLELRIKQHQEGQGANHTKKRLPVALVYFEEFQRIDDAFYREKQIQGWSRKKKEALIKDNPNKLPELSLAYRDKETSRTSASRTQNSLVSEALEDTNKYNQGYYSNGKLLLTGEYVVLDGALALALPTQFGQSLEIEEIDNPKLIWKSLDEKGNVWYENTFLLQKNKILNQLQDDNTVSKRLLQILTAVAQLNPDFLNHKGFKVTTQLDFDINWGLGTSSTLINNIANWANVDAYKLLELTFRGSGYDIACTQHDSAITYQLENEISHSIRNDKIRKIKSVDFNPSFKDHLYFVHLNKKQNSREGIMHYKSNKTNFSKQISEISDITSQLISCKSLSVFNTLIETHEEIIASVIRQKPIKERLFNDFEGSIKSLGAWGGDFVLATSKDNPKAYFETKGFLTVIPYTNMVLNNKSLT
ncbi:MAG: GIY-YIG nuclease family protein [Chlorobi bacterium]|nr:GIY-YIG nuclease family protein [Chlorobiota bacterium]